MNGPDGREPDERRELLDYYRRRMVEDPANGVVADPRMWRPDEEA